MQGVVEKMMEGIFGARWLLQLCASLHCAPTTAALEVHVAAYESTVSRLSFGVGIIKVGCVVVKEYIHIERVLLIDSTAGPAFISRPISKGVCNLKPYAQ